jgi:ParB family chromosome partitioning protein
MIDDPAKRKGLGRGLAALLGDDAAEDYAALDRVRGAKEVPIEQLQPNRFQPRHRFDDEALRQLADSIRAKGVLQPILVRRAAAANLYEIIAGERRWRAAQRAQLHQVPVVIKDLSDAEALELALVENIQRQDLNAIEEAQGYRRLIDEFAHTQEELAAALGKSRSHIANTLRLLALPAAVQAMIEDGQLTAGHARALVNASDPEALARQILDSQLTVRQAESLAAEAKPRRKAPARRGKDADTLALERDLSGALGLKVDIAWRGEAKGGEVRIGYRSLEQLDDLCKRLLRPTEAARRPNLQEVSNGPAATEDAPPSNVIRHPSA